MPIDPSIYFQQKSPDIVGSFAQGQNMRAMLDKQAREKQAFEQAEKIKEAYGAGIQVDPMGKVRVDEGKTISALAQAGAGQEALKFQQESSARALEMDEKKMKKHLSQLDIMGRVLGAAKDQKTWDEALTISEELGLPTDKIPRTYDQSFRDSALARTLTAKDQLMAKYKGQEIGLRGGELDVKRRKLDIEEKKAQQERTYGKQVEKMLTPAQKKSDEVYGKDYTEYVTQGRAKAAASIGKLENLQEEVAKDTGFGEAGGGKIVGSPLYPDLLRSSTAIERRDDSRNFANASLKALFGGNLSDGEREAAAREFWNDRLDNESNAKRIAGKVKELKKAMAEKERIAQHYEKYGTISNLKSPTYDKIMKESKELYKRKQKKGEATTPAVVDGASIEWME